MTDVTRRSHIPELDGIRGLAIAMVIYWHYVAMPHAATQGLGRLLGKVGLFAWSGVDLFFVLSGFLIGGILIEARLSTSYFRTFYIRRAFRIVPIYAVVCVTGIVVIQCIPSGAAVLGVPMPSWVYATFTQNHWLLRNSWDVYLPVTWSLAIEEQFYLTLPFIIRLVPPAHLRSTIAALALASWFVRSALYAVAGSGGHILMPCRADALMLGVLGAIVMRDPRLRAYLSNDRWLLYGAVALFGGGVAIFALKGWTPHTPAMATMGYSLLAMFYLSLLLLAVCKPHSAWGSLMRCPPLRRLGQLAYFIYLTHDAIFAATRHVIRGTWGSGAGADWISAAISLGAVVILAEVSWRTFESRLVTIGHRFAYAEGRVARSAPSSSQM